MFRIILDYPAWGMEKENLILVPFSPVSINNSPFRLDCTRLLIVVVKLFCNTCG